MALEYIPNLFKRKQRQYTPRKEKERKHFPFEIFWSCRQGEKRWRDQYFTGFKTEEERKKALQILKCRNPKYIVFEEKYYNVCKRVMDE